MDRPMYGQPDSSMSRQPAGMQQVSAQLSKWWWLWLVFGTLWIIGSLIILQFQTASLVTVGVIIGVLFLVAGVQELLMAGVAQSWRWLAIVLGVLFVVAGIWALVNPIHTFLAIAEMLGFLFVLIGVLWTVEAFATKPVNDLWFLGLIAGVMMVVLGFWAAGQFIAERAAMLLVFAGIWALFQGITDIIRAFRIKQLGRELGTMGTA